MFVKLTGSENLDALFVRRTVTIFMRKAFLLGVSYKDVRVLQWRSYALVLKEGKLEEQPKKSDADRLAWYYTCIVITAKDPISQLCIISPLIGALFQKCSVFAYVDIFFCLIY